MNTLDRSALAQLSYARMVSFLREPEAIFWVFAFPILLALALGIAFRGSGAQKSVIGVEVRTGSAAIEAALEAWDRIEVRRLAPEDGELALRRGKIALLVRANGTASPTLLFDPGRPETRLAQLEVTAALEQAGGRVDRVKPHLETRSRPGARYIDFLIPGLIGLNLLGTGMWGVGFPIANARQLKLLKRMIATPMRRGDYLLALVLARMVWLVLEVAAIVAFGALAFGVVVRGSWLAFALVTVLGGLAFTALGLLVASRARTIEGVSGIMNFVMMPMWMMSGTFFSSERFPAFMQPVVRALPLTACNDALRAIANEGAGLAATLPELAVLAAWGVLSFYLALKLFRWE